MKKRVLSIVLSAVLALLFVIPVSAHTDTDDKFKENLDKIDKLFAEAQKLEDKAAALAAQIAVSPGVLEDELNALLEQKAAAETALKEKQAEAKAAYDTWQALLPAPTDEELEQLLNDFEAAQADYNTEVANAEAAEAVISKATTYLNVFSKIPGNQNDFYKALGVNSSDDDELLEFVNFINFSFSGKKPSGGNVWSSLRDNKDGCLDIAIAAVTAAKLAAESVDVDAALADLTAAEQAYDQAVAAASAAAAAEEAYNLAAGSVAEIESALEFIEALIAEKQAELTEVTGMMEKLTAALTKAQAKRTKAEKLQAENHELYDFSVVKDFGVYDGKGTVDAHINAKHTDFRKLKLGGKTLSEDDYKIGEGSTVVILTEDFIGELTEGTHDFTAEFEDQDGTRDVELHLTIEPIQEPEPETAPQTGDRDITAFAGVLVLAALAMAVALKRKSSGMTA